jgi:hypothetical protein
VGGKRPQAERGEKEEGIREEKVIGGEEKVERIEKA